MRRITKISSAAFAGAAALALSVAAGAQQGPAASPPPSEAQIAASPAVKRLKELLEVVNRGDAAAMKAYIVASGADPTKPQSGPAALPLVGDVLDLHRRSRGLDLVRVASVEDNGAMAVVRNRLTGDEQALSVKVEPQAPHRITGLPFVPPGLASTLVRPPAVARSERAQLQHIGTYLKRMGDAEIFSGVVMIARDGKPVFSQAYGYADREKKNPNRVETPFLVASVTKLFTGVAIGKLVDQGKLSYEDPLSKFVPDYPDAESAQRIKIKHLLSHSSGVPRSLTPASPPAERLRTIKAAVDIARRGDKLQFEPGTRHVYSNAGFHLLGRVIEVASGEDYYDYLQKHIFAPAGMTSSSFPHHDRDVLTSALPYEVEYDGDRLHFVNKLSVAPVRGVPSGHGTSSAPDLLKLANALRAGRILKPETYRLHTTPKPELGSEGYGYGFVTTWRFVKRPLVGHAGNAYGQCAEFGALADTPYTVIVLSNLTINTCITVTAKILEVLTPTKAPAA